MTLFQVLLLSLVEGVTEFLPISSTGHLILTSRLLAIPQSEFLKTFEIFIQFGAILAVIVLYRNKLREARLLWKPLLFAFLPAALVGAIFYKLIREFLLGNSIVTVISLIVGGIIFLFIDDVVKKVSHKHAEAYPGPVQAVFIGLSQAIAVIPGVSRSGASIIGGLLSGLSRHHAVEFSFLLSIPTIAAASLFDLAKSYQSITPDQYGLLVVGFFGAFISAWVSISWFLRYISTHSFRFFGLYRIFIGILFLLFTF